MEVACGTNPFVLVADTDIVGPRNTTYIAGINFDTSLAGQPSGEACLVLLTNHNGGNTIFAALPYKNGQSKNIAATWIEGGTLLEPRRDHAMVAAQLTDTLKFMYVLGGENETMELSSIERSAVALDGALGDFKRLPTDLDLPFPLSSARAVVVEDKCATLLNLVENSFIHGH